MKVIVIIDNNLKMPKGKLARVVMGAGIEITNRASNLELSEWRDNNRKSVVLKTNSFKELIKKLDNSNITYVLMTDAGKTVFKKPTDTCIALMAIDNQYPFIEELKLV